MAGHHSNTAFQPVGCGVITVSDTRSEADDHSGQLLRQRLTDAGHRVARYQIVTDDFDAIQAAVRAAIADPDVWVLITTGGTGFAPRDVTPDAAEPLLARPIPGFGELFRQLSYDDIGASTIQSRALAGLAENTLVFCLPGSTGACALAMDKIILEQIDNTHRPCNFRSLLDNP